MIPKSKFFAGTFLAIVILCAALFAETQQVSACVCVRYDPAEAFEKASVVFMGEVVVRGETRRYESGYCDGPDLVVERTSCGVPHAVQFQVITVWKGAVSETMYVSAGGSCGYDFAEGETYLVYASGSGDLPYVFAEGGTVLVSEVEERIRALGQGWEPEFGSSGATPTPVPTIPTSCATVTPEGAPIPISPEKPTVTSTPPRPSGANGTCNVVAQIYQVPMDVSPVVLLAGVVWLGFRTRRRR